MPYAFARDNAILLVPKSERDAEVWISDATPLAALNEVIRVFPGKVKPIVVEPGKLVAAISQTYGDQGGSAQQIVGEIESEVDLARMMQELPDVEDLLETEDDAPIIRMINALLTQAAQATARATSTSSRSRRYRWCASASTARCATSCSPSARCTRRWSRASRSWPSSTSPRSACRRTAASRCASAAAPVDVRVSTLPTGARRARRAAPARQGPCRSSSSTSLGMSDDALATLRRPDPPAARHHAGHRPDRLRQDDDAVRGVRRLDNDHAPTS